MGATTSLLSFEEFLNLPDSPGKQELLEGELIEMPPPEFLHSHLSLEIYNLLRACSAAGLVYHETAVQLDRDTCLVPDVMLISEAQRLKARGSKYVEGAPLLAVEVLSPSNTMLVMEKKAEVLLSGGAREVWLVNPQLRRVSVYVPGKVTIHTSELSSPLLPGLRLDLPELFAV